MATGVVRATYALDYETVQGLADLAGRWNMSKSEALRTVIRAADAEVQPDDRLAALDALQASMGLTAHAAAAWEHTALLERRAPSKRAASL